MRKFSMLPGSALLGLCLMMTHPANVSAKQIYQWIDQDGEAHFSDSPPPAEYNAITIELEPTPPSTSPAEDEYSILNQAKRMQESRDAIEARKQAALDREAERRQQQPQPVVIQYYGSNGGGYYYPYYPGYPGYGGRPGHPDRPHRPINPVKPVHPIYPGHGSSGRSAPKARVGGVPWR